jgi:type IV pilus assembly protein PilY1
VPRPPHARKHALAYALSALFSSAASPALAGLDIPNVPLTIGNGSDPNLLYIHDDSASMYVSYVPDLNRMPPEAGFSQEWKCSDTPPLNGCNPGWNYGRGPIGSLSVKQSQILRSPQGNALYYNPAVTYEPPPAPPGMSIGAIPAGTLGNASFTDAWFNGYDIQGRNAANNYAGTGKYAIPRRVDLSKAYKATYSYGATFPSGLRPGEYLSFQGGGRAAHYYSCPNGWASQNCSGPLYMTNDAQKQNFANWYSYYRTRDMTAKAGISRSLIRTADKIRVGWGRINKSAQSNVDGKTLSTLEEGVRPFTDARKRKFLQWLYGIGLGGDTPLRRALDDAGQYYDRSTGAAGPWADDPATSTGMEASLCRRSFAVLMTDGYWNNVPATVAIGNRDGASASFTTPPKPGGASSTWSMAPFRDGYANTLADVAWYYWAKDLLPGTDNKVGVTARDSAWWQHMTTYTVGLGVAPNKANKDQAFYAADTLRAPGFTWPTASTNQIDDLLHAGVNGHGDFFSASSTTEFVNAMQRIIESISDIVAGSGKIATTGNTPNASSGALTFNSTFRTAHWSGELTAYVTGSVGGGTTPGIGAVAWRATEVMPAPAARKIFTRKNNDAAGSSGIEFRWSALSMPQRLDLQEGHNAAHGQNVLDYLRGSNAKELSNKGNFRNRERAHPSRAPLGDSPNNGMLYDKATQTLYLGANDGMLHAFDAGTGVERFAYIPSVLFPKLPRLAHTDYSHEYYVDGEAAVVENNGQHYLAGALGRGGKGLYGLRVTHPAAFSSGDALWELNGRASAAQCGSGANADILDDLGIITGKPVTARLANGKAVVIIGNGYDSCRGKAALYIIDIANGSVLHKIDTPVAGDNGLSSPFAFDQDEDGVLDASDVIYAGDLQGNLWRFAEVNGAWQVSSGGAAQPLFTARNASGQVQPITAQPVAVRHPDTGLPYLFFGTGQFLQNADKADQTVQSWYGLIDGGGAARIERDELRQRHLTLSSETATLSDGTNAAVRLIDQAAANDMMGMRGWFIDFDLAGDPGERIVSPSRVLKAGKRGTVLQVPSIVPSNVPCDDGGHGWIYAIDPFTGAEPGFTLLDVNGDGKVDSQDTVENGRMPAGISPEGLGMPQDIPEIDPCASSTIQLGGTSGNIVSTAINIPGCNGLKGRIFWREIIRQ